MPIDVISPHTEQSKTIGTFTSKICIIEIGIVFINKKKTLILAVQIIWSCPFYSFLASHEYA